MGVGEAQYEMELLEKLISPKDSDCQTHKNRSIIPILKPDL